MNGRILCLYCGGRCDKIILFNGRMMKRLVAVLSGLLVLPSFAEVAPFFYDEVIEYTDADDVSDGMSDDDTDVTDTSGNTDGTSGAPRANVPVGPAAAPRTTSGRTTSRAMGAGTTSNVTTRRSTTSGVPTRTTVSRGVTARTATVSGTPSRMVNTSNARSTNTSRAVGARTTTARSGVSTTTTAARAGTTSAVRNNSVASGNTSVARSATAQSVTPRGGTGSGLVQTDTVNTPLYTGRVSARSNASRMPSVSSTAVSTGVSVSETTTSPADTSEMEDLLALTDYCKTQYAACMDNFCNVLDDNQGRCSCSANLKNYEKTEDALKQATEELQNVAQDIQYIGLSSDEMEALFTQTEAELKLSQSTDTSTLKSNLDKIKDLIVDVKTTASDSKSGGMFDLNGLFDFTIDGSTFDFSNFLGTGTSTTTISNKRGTELFKTAAARCKTSVLNTCAAQGVDTTIVTNAYDLEIDKQCITYERSLSEANTQMSNTVRNAKSVLQRARLMVAQQKNQYDLRECVNALDECMQDDFICGSGYKNCLDPSGRYIVNGKVVVGSTPGPVADTADSSSSGLYSVWMYKGEGDTFKNPFRDSSLVEYIEKTTAEEFDAENKSNDISLYLQRRIGWHDNDTNKDNGMCMSVLNKCQNYTYEGSINDRKYRADNNVVKEYLQRTMVQIKAAQDETLAEYGEECMTNVASCLSQNNISKERCEPAFNACKAMITTCGSINSVSVTKPADKLKFIKGVMGATYTCTNDFGAETN